MRWSDARSLADLGILTAWWLSGEGGEHPNHYGPPADETAELVDVLVAMNRAGLVTIGSQPGMSDEDGYMQRAAVDFLCPPERLPLIRDFLAAHSEMLVGYVSRPAPPWWRQWGLSRGDIVTRQLIGVDPSTGEPVFRSLTDFGGQLRRGDVRRMFDVARLSARREAADAWHVAIMDREWGLGTRMWERIAAKLCQPHTL